MRFYAIIRCPIELGIYKLRTIFTDAGTTCNKSADVFINTLIDLCALRVSIQLFPFGFYNFFLKREIICAYHKTSKIIVASWVHSSPMYFDAAFLQNFIYKKDFNEVEKISHDFEA